MHSSSLSMRFCTSLASDGSVMRRTNLSTNSPSLRGSGSNVPMKRQMKNPTQDVRLDLPLRRSKQQQQDQAMLQLYSSESMGSVRTGGSAIGVELTQAMTGWHAAHYPYVVSQSELIPPSPLTQHPSIAKAQAKAPRFEEPSMD